MKKTGGIEPLVDEEIRRLVGTAIAGGFMISAADYARVILERAPNCGLAQWEVEDQVIMAAARAGVPVELGRGPMTLRDRSSVEARRELDGATRRVRDAELRVEDQVAIIEHLHDLRRDTTLAERLLATYMAILDQFCLDRERLVARLSASSGTGAQAKLREGV